jgi:RNA polymerase sigma factor (TIGR02999 family)
MTTSPQEVTQLLENWRNGDKSALDQLMPLVYDELHRMASWYMRRERAGHTLQTSALVNEAYLRLVGRREIEFQNRAHFFAVAAQVMRRLLVDYARGRK